MKPQLSYTTNHDITGPFVGVERILAFTGQHCPNPQGLTQALHSSTALQKKMAVHGMLASVLGTYAPQMLSSRGILSRLGMCKANDAETLANDILSLHTNLSTGGKVRGSDCETLRRHCIKAMQHANASYNGVLEKTMLALHQSLDANHTEGALENLALAMAEHVKHSRYNCETEEIEKRVARMTLKILPECLHNAVQSQQVSTRSSGNVVYLSR